MKTIEEVAFERYRSDQKLPKHKRMQDNCYIDWANLGAKAAERWISVENEMPENTPWLLDKSIEDLDCTVQVLVKTETGTIMNNNRVKMARSGKWAWVMSIAYETIIEWRPIETR